MKHISTTPTYAEASKHLGELVQAEQQATAEESRLLGLLAAPTQREPVLAAAARLLRGEPAAPADTSGLNRQLEDVRGKLSVLRPAIEQQRVILATIKGELSARVCAEQASAHLDAVQGLADALETTRAALYRLQALHSDIEFAGYASNLEPIGNPAMSFQDGTPAADLLAQCHTFIALHNLRKGPPVNLRLLTESKHGLPGDVVGKVPPADAAQLVRLGHAEVTQDKPRRVQRLTPWGTPSELVLS